MNAIPKTATFSCPCCGNSIGQAAPIDDVMNRLADNTGRLILGKLAQTVGAGIRLDVLVDAAYAGREDGGPINADDSVRVTISNLRKAISIYGWSIVCRGRSRSELKRGGVYRLIPTISGV